MALYFLKSYVGDKPENPTPIRRQDLTSVWLSLLNTQLDSSEVNKLLQFLHCGKVGVLVGETE